MKPSYDVAVMHDFFVDRLVHVGSLRRFGKLIDAKAREGGGGVHGVSQEEIRGGNAVNLAHALGRLGVRTLLLTHADGASERLLGDTFDGLPVDLKVKPARAGLTVALEGGVNVMLGDGGGAGDFGPERLTDEDWTALGKARIVCSVNWAANSRGTALLQAIRAKLGPKKTVFLDAADFRDRVPEFRGLLLLIREEHLVDWVSMNEEEARAACRALGLGAPMLAEACRLLAKHLAVTFDIHAPDFAYRSSGQAAIRAPARRTKAKRLTGAGDVWDAGAIYGRIRQFGGRRTLEFANAAARLYLESRKPVPPTLEEVIREVR